jgi:hypothetical protein
MQQQTIAYEPMVFFGESTTSVTEAVDVSNDPVRGAVDLLLGGGFTQMREPTVFVNPKRPQWSKVAILAGLKNHELAIIQTLIAEGKKSIQ